MNSEFFRICTMKMILQECWLDINPVRITKKSPRLQENSLFYGSFGENWNFGSYIFFVETPQKKIQSKQYLPSSHPNLRFDHPKQKLHRLCATQQMLAELTGSAKFPHSKKMTAILPRHPKAAFWGERKFTRKSLKITKPHRHILIFVCCDVSSSSKDEEVQDANLMKWTI